MPTPTEHYGLNLFADNEFFDVEKLNNENMRFIDTILNIIATNKANKTEVTTEIAAAIAALVDSAPATLDTLNELAAALGDDPNFATTINNHLANMIPSLRRNQFDS